jgi:hypothetical protein
MALRNLMRHWPATPCRVRNALSSLYCDHGMTPWALSRMSVDVQDSAAGVARGRSYWLTILRPVVVLLNDPATRAQFPPFAARDKVVASLDEALVYWDAIYPPLTETVACTC